MEIEEQKKTDLLTGKMVVLQEAKEKYQEAYNYLIEAIEDIESYIDAMSDDSVLLIDIDK